MILWVKSPNRSCRFWAQTEKPVDLGFKDKPRNSRPSSPCSWCRPHTGSPDLLTVRPPSIQHVLDHTKSFAPSLLFLPRSSLLPAMPHQSPAHHKTSKHISSHNTDNMVEPRKSPEFKFKLRQVNYSSQIKPRYWPLGFSKYYSISFAHEPHVWYAREFHRNVIANCGRKGPIKIKLEVGRIKFSLVKPCARAPSLWV
jgi:hypothetical protein